MADGRKSCPACLFCRPRPTSPYSLAWKDSRDNCSVRDLIRHLLVLAIFPSPLSFR